MVRCSGRKACALTLSGQGNRSRKASRPVHARSIFGIACAFAFLLFLYLFWESRRPFPFVPHAHAGTPEIEKWEASRYWGKEEDVDHMEGTTTMRDLGGD